MAIQLPTSGHAPYCADYWQFVVDSLNRLKDNPSLEVLEETLVSFINKTKQLQTGNEKDKKDTDDSKVVGTCVYTKQDLMTLRTVLQHEKDAFVPNVIPSICAIALEMEQLFPSNTLKILAASTKDSVTLNRRQISCLLSHMFFCTFLPSTHLKSEYCGQFVGDNSKNGPLTFQHFYTICSNPTKLYIHALINYFKSTSRSFLKETSLHSNVSFERHSLECTPQWELSETKLSNVFLHLSGSIGDVEGHVEMDFANKNVGFGTTGTQEELLLGTSPESCCISFFNETLQADEALLITGVQKFALFTGYGSRVAYTGPPNGEQRDWARRKILAIDANEYIGNEKVQLKEVHLKRELNKAFCGFGMVSREILDTGHWGCGVFCGNKGLKALLQLMAASEANIQLHFYCFGDEVFYQCFQRCLELLHAKKDTTVGGLWKFIKDYEKYVKKHWVDDGSVNDVGILMWLEGQLSA